MPKRSGRKSKAQTPAPKAERIYGSEKNPKGTAASGKSASKIKLSKKTIDTLKNKLDDFKNKYPTKKNVSLDDLKAVYRRGSGAYSKSHRPTISGGAPNSRAAWSYARVNKFLQKAAGLKVKKAYIQDDDLLKRGGEIDPKAFDLVFYHEKKGNWLFAKNMMYVWLYDDLEAGKKLQSGEYDWVVFPPTAGISAAFRKGYVPPIKAVWTKKFQKDRKGSDKLVGIVEAYYDEQENKLYILMMTTRKDYQRRGVNSYLIKFLREHFKLEKDQVVFDKPTEEGKKFEASGKFEEGGDLLAANEKPSSNNLSEFLEWVIGFNKSVIGKLNVFISVPTELTPFHDYKNTVFLDLFEKIDQDIDAKPYLRQILAKADEYGISIIIEPKPRYKYFENNIEKKNKIDVKYLKEYYSKFGFKPIDEKYMIRKPDQRFEEGGSIQPIETLISKGILELKTFDTKPEHALAYGLKSKNPLYFQTFYVLKENRLNGIGNMALQYLDEYAINNGHDLIFGHIAKSSEPSVDVVKSILEKAGYSLCENNNDFYKYYQAANLLEDDKTLYHGSPYSFDSFSENNIGTGEGNMKYGRGFYFTESREVAERYSLVPSDNSFYINGVQLKDSNLSNDEKAIILAIWREKWEEGYSETKEDYISEILYELEKRSIFDAEAMEGIFSQTELQTLYAQTDIYKKLYDYLSNSYIEIKSYIYEIKPDSNLKLYFTDEEVTDINEKFDGLIYDYPYTDGIKNYVLFSPESFSILSKKEFSKGGNIMKVIECVNCGWKWNSNQSDESDLYVCHQCGFDNTLFYETVNILKPTLTIEQIAKKHNVHEGYIENQLDKGKEHELEHTNNEKVAEKIALHHLAETPDYYEKLETLNLEDGAEIMVDIEPIEYLNLQKKEAEEVLMCSDTKIFKAMICKSKIEMAEKNMDATENPLEKNVWNECIIIWKNCMNNIVKNNIPKMKEGGQPCGCGKIYSKGGLAYGNSHDKGGMPMVVKSTGQNIEIEGGEGVINKRSMQMTKKVDFEGKRMTPCEVISKINQMGGGVKFKCEDVKEIIDADGQF
jgi:GNAT superfamily N-acetyltransferase